MQEYFFVITLSFALRGEPVIGTVEGTLETDNITEHELYKQVLQQALSKIYAKDPRLEGLVVATTFYYAAPNRPGRGRP